MPKHITRNLTPHFTHITSGICTLIATCTLMTTPLNAQDPNPNRTSLPEGATSVTENNKSTDAKSPFADLKKDIKTIDENTIQIGKLKLHKKEHTITFPAKINSETKDLLEYLIINPHGKAHEALLVTDLRPAHLNIAMKLLGYKESLELFQKLDDQHLPTGEYHEVSKEVKKASRFHIYVSWSHQGENKNVHINDLLIHIHTKKSPPIHPFIYNGSYIYAGKFKADESGDLIAVYTDRGSIANYAGDGRDDDSLWYINRELIPEKLKDVTVTFKKHIEKQNDEH